MRLPIRSVLAALAVALLVSSPAAQITIDQPSPSTVLPNLTRDVASLQMPSIDLTRLLEEDAANTGKSVPFRFGEEIPVGFDIKELGTLEVLPDGGVVYRLRITSFGAHSLGLVFSRWLLPDRAGLWVHAGDRSETFGAFSALNNKDNREFAIRQMPGDTLEIEYVEPAGVDFPGEIVVGTVVHDYRGVFAKDGSYSAAGACNVDVNCPQGANWQDEKRAVARILSGGFLCTGALINNTANDGTQLFWTANHCGGMNNAVFLFEYEKSGCGSGSAPTNHSVQGSTLIATNSSVDYRLLRITENIPANFDAYYLGWNRSTSNPSSTVGIHHPSGDVKKISFDNNPATKSGNQWHISQWDLGVTEGGSSGSPLMDPNGRFIGQLCCGAAACGFPFDDYYGRFDLAWSAVKTSLDPLGTNATTHDGFDPANPGFDPGTWTSLGGGVGGLLGTPVLTGSGAMVAGQTVHLGLTNALPFGTTTFIIGLSPLNAPFKGGTLVPNPDALFPGLPLSAGALDIAFTWPAGIPGNTSLWYQHWVNDGSGPQGKTASNGVRGTTAP